MISSFIFAYWIGDFVPLFVFSLVLCPPLFRLPRLFLLRQCCRDSVLCVRFFVSYFFWCLPRPYSRESFPSSMTRRVLFLLFVFFRRLRFSHFTLLPFFRCPSCNRRQSKEYFHVSVYFSSSCPLSYITRTTPPFPFLTDRYPTSPLSPSTCRADFSFLFFRHYDFLYGIVSSSLLPLVLTNFRPIQK